MIFEVLIDDLFLNLISPSTFARCDKKFVLSVINDYADGAWRFSEFQQFIWDNVAQASLSHRERESLVGRSQSELVAAAQNLRLTDKKDDFGMGSELAEIVLYGIMKHHYNALPVVPKIFYKQNRQDNAKGADSVHIVLCGDNDFTLWLGEAKFYNSIENARLASIMDSVASALATDKLKKENSIITSVSDLDTLPLSDSVREQIKLMLSPETSIDKLKPKLHIPILLLHECSITKSHTEMSDDYRDQIVRYHKERAVAYFSKQVERLEAVHKYTDISFHIILFPVPCKKTIVYKFLVNATHYQDQ